MRVSAALPRGLLLKLLVMSAQFLIWTNNVQAGQDSRLVAFMANWEACPSVSQLRHYTHVMISFATTYTDGIGNDCSTTCYIYTPTVCNSAGNPELIRALRAAGKKVLISFGGAAMGGHWESRLQRCWDYCFGREAQVVARLTDIVRDMELDGVDIDYEYFYDDNQNNRGFRHGARAQKFIREVSLGLRDSLPEGSLITHAPIDVDVIPGTGYFNVLTELQFTVDFLMVQYYNGVVRANADGFVGRGEGSISGFEHTEMVGRRLFKGDMSRVVYGFCINDCAGQASGSDAAKVMVQYTEYFECNGGAFFWVAHNDPNGVWSEFLSKTLQESRGCASSSSKSVTTTFVTPLVTALALAAA